MTDKQLIGLAKNMRMAQMDYFRTRSKEYLQRAKRLERDFDMEIKRRSKAELGAANPKLFLDI